MTLENLIRNTRKFGTNTWDKRKLHFQNADIEGVTKEIFGSKETIDKVI